MNHYERLGVDRDVTSVELARAYRKLARQHHPDRNGDDTEQATKRMVALNEAFAVLSDPVRRFDYDRSLDRASGGTSKSQPPAKDPISPTAETAQPEPPPDDPVRRARREAKERAAAEAKRRGYRDHNDGRMNFRAPD